ncbi:DnaB-like dsDNA helicase [Rhodococcus phage NiceHouse]|nr:DnaB-like dsDNA helicase [Rhodococcus phage NiceHouse]
MNHEIRVLSALLKNNDMASVMGDNLPALLTAYGDTYGFIQKYYETNKSLPPVSIVKEEYPDFDYLENIEGATKHYVEALREHQVGISVQEMLQRALKTVTNKEQKASDVVARLNTRLSEISRSTGIARSVDVRDAAAAEIHYDKVRELARLHGGKPGISTGFDYIDDHYPTGMAPGHFIVLMGYSGLGKTWFAIKLAINAWEQGFNVLMINLEMTPEELRDRIYFLISHYSMDELVKADIDPDQFRRWAIDYMDGKSQFNIIGTEGGDFTTAMVQQKIEQFKPDLVICDYMQLFWDRNMSIQDTARAKNASSEFKAVAMNTKVPILMICAVTGKDKKDRVNPPEIAQLAWSSQMEYDANLCFAVHTHRNPVSHKAESTEIVCRKNRHGPLFSFRVFMDLDAGTIEPIEALDQYKLSVSEDEALSEIFDKDMPASDKIASIQQEQLG